MKFSNILLVLDARRSGDVLALLRAAEFARTEGATLTVCEIIDWSMPHAPRYVTDGTVRVLTDAIRANKIQRLKELVANSGGSNPDISVELLVGKPHIEVARMVREKRYDLVIKQLAGRRAMRFFADAQEDRELMRNCPCPVWFLKGSDQGDSKSILAALDMQADGAFETGINQRIVEVARSIALAESRPLHVVHAWRLRGEGHLRAQCNPATDLHVERMRVREASRRKTWLQNMVAMPRSNTGHSAAGQIKPELHVVNGHAKKVIPDLAEKLGAGLIVVGTAARTGISGVLRPNTAETLLPRSDCSLLVVKQPAPVLPPVAQSERTLQVG